MLRKKTKRTFVNVPKLADVSVDDVVATLAETLPRFPVRCKTCRFLGQYGPFDLYVCDDGENLEALIARYGDTPDDFYSVPTEVLRKAHPVLLQVLLGRQLAPLVEAYHRLSEPTVARAEA